MASHTPTSSTLITTTPDSSSLTILDRLQNFISENRRAIIIASAAAIVVGGVGVAYYSASSSASSRPTGKKKDKKGKGKKSGKKSPNDADGPVLEKLEPEEPEEEGPGASDTKFYLVMRLTKPFFPRYDTWATCGAHTSGKYLFILTMSISHLALLFIRSVTP